MVRLLPYLEYAKRTIMHLEPAALYAKRVITHLEPAALIGLGALVLLIVLSVSLSLENETNSFNSTVMTIIYFLLIISVSGQLLYYFRSSKTNQKSTQG
jgi:ACR3 family arsenite efflux pump ArsB